MSSEYDPSDFVDSDFQSARKATYTAAPAATATPVADRPPSREEVDTQVSDTQVKIAELKRAQEELERERSRLEEVRRRQIEFQTGREEMLQHLTRGLGLLEEAEFGARRDAEEMSKALTELRSALEKLQTINDQEWNKENYQVELTRALTVIENARMEWNSARLKFSILSTNPEVQSPAVTAPAHPLFTAQTISQLCKLGLALTWPLVLLGLAIFLTLMLRR